MITKDHVFLVVDDFEAMRRVTAAQLRSLGAVNVITANNGLEALRILKRQKVDVVLSDWNMPLMTGLELLNSVRSDPKLNLLPFVMITGEAARERVSEAIAGGVSDLLVKPYNAGELANRVEKALAWRPRRQAAGALLDFLSESWPSSPGELPVVPPTVPVLDRNRRLTILVVDDTPDNLQFLSRLFKDEYRVRIAHNGEKAVKICCADNPPDLVLLDIMMPGIDGFEVARRMRQHHNAALIPIVFVTAISGDEARIEGLELGAVDFVTKPIDSASLILRVRNFMRYVELHRQLQADYDLMLDAARLQEDVDNMTRHDLKGPLSAVIGLIQAMSDDSDVSRKQGEQLRMVEETAMQVLNMINLSSELYKIESGRFQLQPQAVEIGDILRRSVQLFRNTFNERHLTIAVDTDFNVGAEQPLASGDAMFCYSLFQNLIKNACEASPEGGRVAVKLFDESPIRVSIVNTGAVPVAIRDGFFGKFVTCGKPGGSGIGTYSARLLAEAQLGEVALDVSDARNLTTLTVTLPRHVAPRPQFIGQVLATGGGRDLPVRPPGR